MKFQDFINEYQDVDINRNLSRVKEISADEAKEILETKASDALAQYKKGKFLQRVTDTATRIGFGKLDASKMKPRMSRNTSNYYTQIMNNDQSWSSYPKRQIIGSYRQGSTGDYGLGNEFGTFIIFPYNNTKVGRANSDDLWDSFPELSKVGIVYASRFNGMLDVLFNRSASSNVHHDKSLGEIKKKSKEFDKWFSELEKEPGYDLKEMSELLAGSGQKITAGSLYKFLKNYYKGDLYKSILKFINPRGFGLMKPSSYTGSNWDEIWLDGPALYINASKVEDFISGDYKEDEFEVSERQKDVDVKKPRGRSLDLAEAVELIKKNAPKTWKKFVDEDSWISRISYSGRPDYSFIDTKKMPPRMSRNTSNYYTHIMNEDPTWKGFPRRQIIGSAGYKSYSGPSPNTYLVIPYDGVPIGVGKATDIWMSFKELQKHGLSANIFNEFINVLLNHTGKSALPSSRILKSFDGSLNELKKKAKEFDKWYNGEEFPKQDRVMAKAMNRSNVLSALKSYDMGWFMDKIYPNTNNLYKALLEVFSPKGQNIVKSGSGNLPIKAGNEVWFDGPAIYIDSEIAEAMKTMDMD